MLSPEKLWNEQMANGILKYDYRVDYNLEHRKIFKKQKSSVSSWIPQEKLSQETKKWWKYCFCCC